MFHEGGTFKGKQWCKLKRGGQPKLAPTREPAVPHTPLIFQVWAKRLLLFPGVHRAALTAHQTLPFHSPLTSLFVWSARVIKFPSGFPTETLANKGRDIFAENHKEKKKKKKKTQTFRKKKRETYLNRWGISKITKGNRSWKNAGGRKSRAKHRHIYSLTRVGVCNISNEFMFWTEYFRSMNIYRSFPWVCGRLGACKFLSL